MTTLSQYHKRPSVRRANAHVESLGNYISKSLELKPVSNTKFKKLQKQLVPIKDWK